MILPLNFDDLSVLLAMSAIILLVTSQLITSSHRKILVNRKRLRRAAIVFSIFFLITIVYRIVNVISPF